ncbi:MULTISPECIES: glycosyltransferase [Dethiosulfovibrio]|uniref:Glycosyltransferase n=2 Tax=Dethiosulfovibrio TaxID=47054 RepID=A0ABS9EQM8_9BACT|nr:MULTISPECIES: glycosyltransferase [Dethiosulfovibrio]MCF4113141.1 glycosyltransferase [Dethiosulfovibrio russensis]MCF4142205.1 glycosyltransferase [Dethiosulfovibrio marinus]MCF4146140.1 glycosyltransferase [Dethiosulfovibrio acidaminovorans]
MKSRKYLIVTTVSVTLEAFLLPQAERLKDNGWQVDCLANGASKSEKCHRTFDHCHDIGWGRTPLDLKNFTEYPERIRRLERKNEYDVVHVHTPVASFVTRFALKEMRREIGSKVIYTAHGFHFYRGGNPVKNALFLGLEKLASRWTDELEVINGEDYQAAITHLLPRERVRFLKDGVGLDRAHYNPDAVPKEAVQQARRDMGLTDGDVLFTMIAEFNRGKRHSDLINAFAMVKDPRAHLAFLGKGKLIEKSKELCRNLGIAERVHFLGHVPDVRPYILASRTTVLPSEREGLPRSVMESIALKVPVIGANARGTRDLLKDGGGWIVPVGGIAEMKETMEKAIGTRGRKKASMVYCVFQDIKPNMMGVAKKVKGQVRHMSRYFDLSCLFVGNHDMTLAQTIADREDIVLKDIPRSNILSYRVEGLRTAYDWISRHRPDYLYLRYPLGCPFSALFTYMVSRMGVKIITEHQSKEPHELRLLKKYHFMVSDWLFGRLTLLNVSLIIGVTPEIRDFEKNRAPHSSAVCMTNGIDVEDYPARHYESQSDKEGVDLLFCGALASWHGLDRLISAMAKFYECPVRLHIAGEGEEMDRLRSMVEKLPPMHSVTFYGYLDKGEISDLFDRCDAAIGSLALDRNGLRQACTLKTREYAARGIPFVINYDDPDFRDIPWVLQIPSHKEIDVRDVVSWIKKISATPNQIRAYSSKTTNYDKKIRSLATKIS